MANKHTLLLIANNTWTDTIAAIVRISSVQLNSADASNYLLANRVTILPSIGSTGNSASLVPNGTASLPCSSRAFSEYNSYL